MEIIVRPEQRIEYDFTLDYPPGMDCPFSPGDPVRNGIRDGLGKIVHFVGVAFVVLIETHSMDGAKVYVKRST